MKAEKILKDLNEIAEFYDAIKLHPKFESLTQELKSEITLAEQKKAGKADRFKAALRNSKKINKEWLYSRPGIAGAFILENGKRSLKQN